MTTRTIAVDSKDLERGIEALSSAARAFQLTPFERIAYRALIISVDVAGWSFVAYFAPFIIWSSQPIPPVVMTMAYMLLGLFALASVVAIVLLVLNISLLRKLYRERARLKELGLSSLSKSLWKESRRSRWISRVRRALLIVVGIFILFIAVAGGSGSLSNAYDPLDIFFGMYFGTIAALLFGARYLSDQRERIELIANAEELKKALEGLRERAGKAEVVSVPSELLEQAARIESAQIAKERKEAVLQSLAVRPSGYAITFDRDAAEERSALSVADRVELEDLVAQLSTEGAQFESQAGAVAGAEGRTLRVMTKTQRVEIGYVIDQASHGIRITAVRRAKETAPTAPERT